MRGSRGLEDSKGLFIGMSRIFVVCPAPIFWVALCGKRVKSGQRGAGGRGVEGGGLPDAQTSGRIWLGSVSRRLGSSRRVIILLVVER